MIEFNPIQLKDKAKIDNIFALSDYNSTDYCFTTLFIWKDFYGIKIGFYNNYLIIRYDPSPAGGKETAYLFPVGIKDEQVLQIIINELLVDSKKNNRKLIIKYALKDQVEFLTKFFPEKFIIEEDRNNFDYIYNASDLIFLHGKKFQSKRNYITRFQKLPGWSFEEINESNIKECYEMNKEWCIRYGCIYDISMKEESCAVYCALNYFNQLKLKGALLRLNGKVIAFTVGEMINSDTFIVHIEKAFSDICGAYPSINNMFLKYVINNKNISLDAENNELINTQIGFKYINREDDAGNIKLRIAKMQYHPAFLLEKYCVKEK